MPKGCIRRNGRYSIRKVIPVDLQPSYGRREIVRALGTSDPKEARRSYAIALTNLEAEFSSRRSQLAITLDASASKGADKLPYDELAFREYIRATRQTAREENDAQGHNTFLQDWLTTDQRIINGEIDHPFSYDQLSKQRNVLRAELTGESFIPIDSVSSTTLTSKGDDPFSINASEFPIAFDQWSSENRPKRRTIARCKRLLDLLSDYANSTNRGIVDKKTGLSFQRHLLDKGLTPENINVYFGLIRTVINYGVKKMIFSTNPLTGISLKERKTAREKRRTWTLAELNLLFSSRIYSDDYRPLAGGGDACYWLPLIALFTGARETELGQLHPDDIYKETYRDDNKNVQAAWVIRLVKNEDRQQGLKNPASVRRFPIHSTLIELGLVSYAQTAAANGQQRLFPHIEPNSVGELMGNWSKWFGRYRRSIGLKGADPVFHSLRHNFKQFSRLSEINPEQHNAFTGHRTGDVADDYGDLSFPLRPLVSAIYKFEIPELDLSHLYTRRALPQSKAAFKSHRGPANS